MTAPCGATNVDGAVCEKEDGHDGVHTGTLGRVVPGWTPQVSAQTIVVLWSSQEAKP